ncbi:hypothetical protein ACTOV4_00430 [Brucella sp. C7-11G]
MVNELKPWKYDIQYGPEGEANYAWVYDDHGVMVATMKTHKAKEIVERMNTRPAAPVECHPRDTNSVEYHETRNVADNTVEGLERYRPANYMEMCLGGMFTDKDGEYVRFDQAEAIIAAERNRAEVAEYKLDQAVNTVQPMIIQRAERAEADNAALTARVKELEGNLEELERDLDQARFHVFAAMEAGY